MKTIVVDGLSALLGGGQTYLRNLLAHLDPAFPARIVVLVPPGLGAELRVEGNVECIEPGFATRGVIARGIWYLLGLPRLLRDLDADVLYCPGGMLSTRRGSVRTAVAFRNMLPFSDAGKRFPLGYDRFRLWLLRVLQGRSFRNADLVVFISQHGKSAIDTAVPARQGESVVIPHGISDHFRRRQPHPEDPRLPQRYVLYVSTVTVYKAHLEVIEAWAKVKKGRPLPEKLVLVGPEYAPYALRVRERIRSLGLQEDVVLLGNVRYQDLPGYYQNAKFNIFASSCENCPNILLEAMAAGRPVLCSNYPPMPEFGRDAVEYFDPYDPQGLADRMLALLDDDARCAAFGSACAAESQRYRWSDTATLTWNTLLALATKHGRTNLPSELVDWGKGTDLWLSLKKFWRFVGIYGPDRTFYKALGRTRALAPRLVLGREAKRDIGMVGCGQYAYATIAYFVTGKFGYRFADCFDTDPGKQMSFAFQYGIVSPSTDVEALFENENIKLIYIASNHASHSDYAVRGLNAGKAVYVEKPVSVDMSQFLRLRRALHRPGAKIYAGYNRPFSRAIQLLRRHAHDDFGPITLGCHIVGHAIPAGHWYRNPSEGTRICGNVGHWLDLAMHVLKWRGLPDRMRIAISYSDQSVRDDNLQISLVSDAGDLVSVVITSRHEPFEGIMETINFQSGSVIATIDDFRSMTVWQDERVWKYKFWPKDVGHKGAIMQPFAGTWRDWTEVELSTLLMLKVKDMVVSGAREAEFSTSEAMAELDRATRDSALEA